jgi:hypothetical protein
MIFEAEEKSRDDFKVKNFDDCSGDIDGADAFITQGGRFIRVQIKFYLSPFRSEQRSKIIEDYNKVKSLLSDDDEWMLITPDGLHKRDILWFNEQFGENAIHKGEPYLTELFFKHPEIGQQVYPNHEFKKLVKQFETPKYAEEFFYQFIKPDADIERLFANAQPTYYDCKRVFTDDWWELMGDLYNEFYRDLNGIEKEKLSTMTEIHIDQLELREIPAPYQANITAQKVRAVDILIQDTVHYKIKFSNLDGKDYTYLSWMYLNGRWVFFGKINRFFRAARKIRHGEDLRAIMSVLRCFRTKRIVKDNSAVELRLLDGEIVRNLKD